MSHQIYIGYDSKEVEAYHVLAHSIIRQASAPISITPVKLDQLPMARERTPTQSTEFSFSRFLTPWLSDFRGWSLFLDCDMLVTEDIVQLFNCANERFAVQVVKHEYAPTTATKFLGQNQSRYQRKNWSSVMLFNNARCRYLTPATVNADSGLNLHQFKWLSDKDIGELPLTWNWLVGEYEKPSYLPNNLHWTIGGPWFAEYRNAEYADLWFAERALIYGTNV